MPARTVYSKLVPAMFAVIVVSFVLTFSDTKSASAQQPASLMSQTSPTVAEKSAGCKSCHTTTDSDSMHASGTVPLGCTDCHGGNGSIRVAAGATEASREYAMAKEKAHVQPTIGNARAPRQYTNWLKQSAEYIQFVNPGDLRVADRTCGTSGCHASEVSRVRSSMMTHGAMLWSAALYNNGAFPLKDARFGESYGRDGEPQRLNSWPPPTDEERRAKGILPYLDPLSRWETSQPGNVLRVFERGGEKREELGNPLSEEAPGRPDVKLSDRGFGTLLRTDPVFLGLQKTRLLDPMLSFPGTNDNPGDYRGSGCSGCHVLYANDRDPAHSGEIAKFGNEGKSISADPTTPKNESGHALKHSFTLSIPSSQCMVCHIHPGTNMVATYFGYTWWDNETDGNKMYPAKERKRSPHEVSEIQSRNPEGAAQRGLWSDFDFLKKVGTADFNADLQHTQFADFHSHGWIFRAVFKRDRHGNLLNEKGEIISPEDPEKFKQAVHLKDIHLEKGMHCVDCHFEQDSHGNGKLYGETRNAVEIGCVDCHGTVSEFAKLTTSGPAARAGGDRLERLRTPWQMPRFYQRDGKIFQRSVVDPHVEWEVVQVKDSVDPASSHYSEKSAYAKTLQRDGSTWGKVPADWRNLAHPDSTMTCATCHTSWAPNCFGCHLSMTANQRTPMLHNEGTVTRNWTSYNFQVLRDDAYMLGIDGTVTGNRVSPVRSACAIVVSSQNQNRDWLYYGQQTVSAEGFSGQAFSTFVPHTVRAKETKTCTDCHVSAAGDNNAWMSQLLLLGTNFLNYMGRYAYVAEGEHGVEAIAITEHEQPEAVYGSNLHRLAYPTAFSRFEKAGRQLETAAEHSGTIYDVQLRGEYLYAATGEGGLRVYDVANIDNKDFSERITTAPVSPLGQRLAVKTRFAMAVATPSTLAFDATRTHLPQNEEQKVHPMYAFLYVADKYEGLVIVGDTRANSKAPGVSTLLNGDPRDNFLRRALAFNPDGALNGARRITIAGTFAYVLCDRGLVVVDLDDPLHPRVTSTLTAPEIREARGIAIQFRYAFLVDADGLKVLDVTDLAKPKIVSAARLPFEDARNIYVARTYAYVSAGKQGIGIVNVEKPEQPELLQMFNAEGRLSDTNDLKISMVNASQYGFVADGRNGFKVVQLFSPDTSDQFYGFSPRPVPKLIAWKRTRGQALAVSKGVDRDRAVDESGNQLAVFGRRGARPFNQKEMQRMYLRNGGVYTVSDTPKH